MSLKPMPIPPVPEEMARVARAVFPRGNVLMQMRRLDWKYALSLELTDPGFDHTVLSEFRSRLIEGNAEQRLLDLLLERCREGGWLKVRGRQRTDSTHVLAKIRALNRTLCVGQTMVYVLNVLSEVAPEWVRAYVPTEWVEQYGERLEHERLPKEEEERKQYANQVGADGWALLEALECRSRIHAAF